MSSCLFTALIFLVSSQSEDIPNPSTVFVSSLQRALQTAILAFASDKEEGIAEGNAAASAPAFHAIDDLREQSGLHHCDRRRAVTEIRKQFPQVDVSLLPEEDKLWSIDRETKLELAKRSLRALKATAASSAECIAIVTHSSFLLTLFTVVLELHGPKELGEWFATGECRVLVVDMSNIEEAQ